MRAQTHAKMVKKIAMAARQRSEEKRAAAEARKNEKQKELQLKQNTYAKQDDCPLPISFAVVGCDIFLPLKHCN